MYGVQNMLRYIFIFLSVILCIFSNVEVNAETAVNADIKRLVVLDFVGMDVDAPMLSLLTEQAIAGTVQVIDKNEVLVMTRESTIQIMKDMGKDVNCIGGQCEVEVARNIGADYVVSGSVTQTGMEVALTLKLHDSYTGALLFSKVFYENSLSQLGKGTPEFIQHVLAGGVNKHLSESGQEEVAQGDNLDLDMTGDVGLVHFISEPKGGIVLVDGHLICPQTPCSAEVPLGIHRVSIQKERYQPKFQTLNLKKESKVVFPLEPDFGYLNVSTRKTDPDIMMFLDGKRLEKLPIIQAEVARGEHVLSVHDDCYRGREHRIIIEAGETLSLENYHIRKKITALMVTTTDQFGEQVEADIFINGKLIGRTDSLEPLMLTVPVCSPFIGAETEGMIGAKRLRLKENKISEINIVLQSQPQPEKIYSYDAGFEDPFENPFQASLFENTFLEILD